MGDWFNKNTELKSFLFNYSVGLGLNLGFMGLGGWVQGFDPYSFEIVLKMAGLQVTDAFMSSVGQRGIRTLVEKGYANGRKEQGFFALLNLLGQVQVNAVWSQNFLVYGVMLGLRSVIQGLTFMASRMLPAKTPNLFVVHANLSKLGQNRNQETVVRGAPELNSLFYMEGITVPEKPIDHERIAEIVREATPGTTGINSLLERFGEFVHIQKWTSNSAEGQGAPSSSHRASKASHDPILCRAIGF